MLKNVSSLQLGNLTLHNVDQNDFTNLWEWHGREVVKQKLPKVVVKPAPVDVWRPKLCHSKGPLYVFDSEDVEPSAGKEELSSPNAVDTVITQEPKQRVKICVICRRPPVDPVTFDCGHKFCRLCIAQIRPVLLQNYAESIQDIRTQIRCPFPSCHFIMPCRPLVNGDFRFHEIHPEDKVQILKVSPSEIEALKSFRVSIDIDFTRKCRSDLFGRYNDI